MTCNNRICIATENVTGRHRGIIIFVTLLLYTIDKMTYYFNISDLSIHIRTILLYRSILPQILPSPIFLDHRENMRTCQMMNRSIIISGYFLSILTSLSDAFVDRRRDRWTDAADAPTARYIIYNFPPVSEHRHLRTNDNDVLRRDKSMWLITTTTMEQKDNGKNMIIVYGTAMYIC